MGRTATQYHVADLEVASCTDDAELYSACGKLLARKEESGAWEYIHPKVAYQSKHSYLDSDGILIPDENVCRTCKSALWSE